VIDTAAILVYMRWSVNVFQLPYISYAGGIGNSVDFIVKPSRLFITRFAFDNSGSIGFSSSLEYRYIIIPGGVLSAGTKSINENGIAFENLTYAELCDLLKIPL
jgi:ABC-type sugar transport system permease subunit